MGSHLHGLLPKDSLKKNLALGVGQLLLFRVLESLVHNDTDAEDLVQESWLRLYEKRGRKMSKPLLFTTIRNLVIDRYRRAKLVVFNRIEEEEFPDPISLGNDVALQDLEQALAVLRPEEREAIFLNSVEGYTVREIAAFTQRSRGTVLSLMHRGKRKMVKALNGMWVEKRENAV